MDLDEYTKYVASTKILSAEEALNIMLHISGVPPREELPFPTTKRKVHEDDHALKVGGFNFDSVFFLN